jgi:uncharacterized membrane protein SpoIIM required for sporulation
MKESEFIEQNKKKWLDFENNLLKKDADPATTSKLFIQITDDLSYARTFYQNRSVRLYLNGVAKLLFNDLNKSQKKGKAAFVNFWKKELPLTVYGARRAMLISLLVFIACFTLGVVTSIQDKEFAASILSADYVNMTNENIAKGDAMAVYKSESELRTFLPILYNNLRVEFLTFFSGIFMAIGSLVVMVINGVMVGVFQYFFIERGLFWESFLAIWTHGALEISTIVLSGGAGLTLGKGLLFPGTHTRFQAFKLSGMNGLKILMGVAPVTFLAAFIEGFLTRHTSIPDPLRFLFILLSFAFIFIYFFWYPRRVAKQNLNNPINTSNSLIYKQTIEFDASEIYSGGKIITETFSLFFNNFFFFGKFLIPISILYAILVASNPLNLFHAFDTYSFSLADLFKYDDYPFLAILGALSLITILLVFQIFIKKKLNPTQTKTSEATTLSSTYTTLVCVTLFTLALITGLDFAVVIACILLPFLILLISVSHNQQLNFAASVSYLGSLIMQSWSRFLMSSVLFVVFSLIVYFTALKGLNALLLNDALVFMLTDDDVVAEKISQGLMVFQTSFSFFIYVTLSMISSNLLFFTLKEMYTAEHLLHKIKSIKINK